LLFGSDEAVRKCGLQKTTPLIDFRPILKIDFRHKIWHSFWRMGRIGRSAKRYYGALLFATAAASPSVIQIGAEDIRPASAEHAVLFALEAAAEDLSTRALVTMDPRRLRISTLPLRRGTPEPS